MNTDALTAGDIDAIPAGRELDALIAVNVFGATIIEQTDSVLIFYDYRARLNKEPFTVKHYSTEIAAAWEVVNIFRFGKLKDKAAAVMEMRVNDAGAPDCECRIFGPTQQAVHAYGDEMSLAICRASLKAVLTK